MDKGDRPVDFQRLSTNVRLGEECYIRQRGALADPDGRDTVPAVRNEDWC